MSTIERLKRRKLVQWTLAYSAAAWASLQVLDFLTSRFGWSEALLRIVTVILAFGIGAVLVLAWFHGDHGAQRVSPLEGVLLAVVMIAAGTSAYAVREGGGEAPAERPRDDGSVAVVPFRNLSEDPSQENFTAGFTDELSTALAGEGLFVVAPTAFTFEGPAESVRKVALQLAARYLLEGSVMRAATQVRVNARLVTAVNGRQVWAGRYEETLSPANILRVQGEIARAIVAALRVQLVPRRQPRVTGGTDNQEAYDAYLRGLGALAQVTRAGNEVAAREFSRALELDSLFAKAHSGLAFANFGWWVPPPDRRAQMMSAARRAAARALELDSTLSEPHVVLANLAFETQDTVEERRQLEAAIRKDPAAGWPHYFMGARLLRIGDRAGGVAQADTLLALDPTSSWNHIRATNLLTVSGEFARSDSAATRAEQLIAMGFGPQPTWALYWNRAINALMRGEYDAAADFFTRGYPPGMVMGLRQAEILRALAAAQQQPGTPEQRRQAALGIVDRNADALPFVIAFTLYRQLDRERMYALLEKRLPEAMEDPYSWAFEPIRTEPRFLELVPQAHQ